MTLTLKQSELWQLFSTANTILAEGGGRSGKTVCIMSYIVARALKWAETDHLIGRFRFAHAKQSICFQTMTQLSKLDGVSYNSYLNKTDWIYCFPNGSRLWIAGWDSNERVEKILGNEYATIYFNEASQASYETIEMVSTRLNPPKGVPGKRIFDLNPPKKTHYAYQIFHERKFPDGRVVPDNDYKWLKINPIDNPNISKQYIETLNQLSTAKRKRFLEGEWGTDDGTLWRRAWIKYSGEENSYQRIVVGVDPSGSVGGDEVGIVACGKIGNEYRVLDDYSCHGTPAEWAAEVASIYHKWKADCVIAESNFGGDMVAHTIRTADPRVNVKLTHSSRGKIVRAEPISALYERGLVKHRVPFMELEDEMCGFSPETTESPNRVDSLVFALSSLSENSGGGFQQIKLTGL